MTPPLSPSEQLIWASLYASYVSAGNSAATSARSATTQLHHLRRLTLEDLERARPCRTATSGADAFAAVEQMRGSA